MTSGIKNRKGLREHLRRMRGLTRRGIFETERTAKEVDNCLNGRLIEALNGLPTGSRVLEVGTGHAIAYRELKKQFPHLEFYGTNYTDNSREYYGDGVIRGQRIAHAEGSRLPYQKGLFDLVYSAHVFTYIPDKLRHLEEVHRVLKPGGTALVHRVKEPDVYASEIYEAGETGNKIVNLSNRPEITTTPHRDVKRADLVHELIEIKKTKPKLTFGLKLDLKKSTQNSDFYSVYIRKRRNRK